MNKTKPNKRYFLSFIEESILNPQYSDEYIGGRIEIWTNESPYSIEEIRFFTYKRKDFLKFRSKWDFKKVNLGQLRKIKKIVKEKFYSH